MSDFEERKLQAIATAGNYQQYYYEMLPDWFEYGPDDYTLIKQKIGYAIFGPPTVDKITETEISSTTPSSIDDQQGNVFNRIVYDKKMCKVIDTIYKQIIQCGGNNKDRIIYIGIIYNVLFPHAASKTSKQQSNEPENALNNLRLLPLFKVRKDLDGVWYIDNDGRVYKSWADYINNNTLPKCTMILPKCGLYQSNPQYKIAECCSTVWLEVHDSPACSTKGKILRSIDFGANAMSVCTAVGLGVVGLVTPIGPVAVTAGLVYSGISGSWIIARSSQKLVDLAKHKQSISPIDKNAFPAWLGIGASAFAMGATGGSAIVSQAAKRATAVGSTVRTAYNSMLIGSLAVNGLGVAYQSYCLIDKYKTTRDVDLLDIVMFASHVLFFSHTLISTKLAGELIETTNGTIFERLKNSLSNIRFTKEFNKAGAGRDQVSSGSIIHKLRNVVNKEDFLNNLNAAKSFIQYSNGKIVIRNKVFVDPVIFTSHLLTAGSVAMQLVNPNSTTTANDVMIRLKVLLVRLMKDYFAKEGFCLEPPNVNMFTDVLQEIKFMDSAVEVLTKVFKIAVILVQNCNEPGKLLYDAIFFTWNYCKANLKEYETNTSNKCNVFSILTRIVMFLFECIDEISHELFSALYTFISNRNMEPHQSSTYN